MEEDFLKQIKCPYCGSDFDLGEVYQENERELINGYIKCECSEFPLLEGIVNIKLGPLNNQVVRYLKERKIKDAIELSLEQYSECAYKLLGSRGNGTYSGILGRFLGGLLKVRAKRLYRKYADEHISFYNLLGRDPSEIYLKHRFSSETLWSFYPFIHVLKGNRKRILDLGCGMGHASFVISNYVKPQQLVCADYSFRHLYLTKKYSARNATFICLDANYPLPFKDGTFSSILMLDALHYVDARALLASEMERTLSQNGLLLLVHVHNSLNYNLAAGRPLSPSGWINLFPQFPIKALPEKKIVVDFIEMNKLDLAKQYTTDELNSSNAISIVGTRDKSLFRTYQNVWSDLLCNKTNMIINPIYSIAHKQNKIILRRKIPNESFWREYQLTGKYLADEYTINENVAKMVKGRNFDLTPIELSKNDLLYIEDLMRRFILINVPENYC